MILGANVCALPIISQLIGPKASRLANMLCRVAFTSVSRHFFAFRFLSFFTAGTCMGVRRYLEYKLFFLQPECNCMRGVSVILINLILDSMSLFCSLVLLLPHFTELFMNFFFHLQIFKSTVVEFVNGLGINN